MANVNTMDGLEGIETPDQVQEEQDAQYARSQGGTSAQQIFGGAQRAGYSLFGNPRLTQAQNTQQAIGNAIQDSDANAPDDETGLDGQLRRLKAVYEAVADKSPGAAMQIGNKIALLQEAKTQQAKINAQTDLALTNAKKAGDLDNLALMSKGTMVVGNPQTGKIYGRVSMFDDQGNLVPGAQKQIAQTIADSKDPDAQAVQSDQWWNNKAQLAAIRGQYQLQLSELRHSAGQDGMDPDTAKMAAYDVIANPQDMRNYASFGQVGQARRDQINSSIKDVLNDAGTDLSALPALRAQAKAYATVVNKQGPQVANLAAFSSLVDNNMQRLDALSSKVNPSQFRTINDWVAAIKREGGSEDAAEMQSILTTTQTELAKLLTTASAGGNAAVSDSARHEMQLVLDGTLPPSALHRVMGRLRLESQLKVQFANDQIRNATDQISRIANGQPGGQGNFAGATNQNPGAPVAPGAPKPPLNDRISAILGGK